jgi:hypothetical protein
MVWLALLIQVVVAVAVQQGLVRRLVVAVLLSLRTPELLLLQQAAL